MTLLQKIQNITWWTLDIKIKDILTDLFGRVKVLEDTPSGGVQDLQSILDNGKNVEYESSYAYILDGEPNNRATEISSSNGGDESSYLTIYNNYAKILSNKGVLNAEIGVELGEVSIKQVDGSLGQGIATQLIFELPLLANTIIKIPAKGIDGEYIVATLDDLPQVANDFANDTAAAIGGIAVGGLYHTAGAVKIRLS